MMTIQPDRQYLHLIQKMELMGALLGEIVHDINNEALLISSMLEIILQSSNLDKKDTDNIEKLFLALDNINILVNKLAPYACAKSMDKSVIGLNRIIEELGQVVSSTIDRQNHGGAVCDTAQQIYINEQMFRAALLDMVTKFLRERNHDREFRITASDALVGDMVDLELSPEQDFIKIEVIDSGKEIPPHLAAEIFSDPFYAPKSDPKMIGLDLSMIHMVVMLSNGGIACFSEPDIGTTIKILLPAVTLNGAAAA